MSIIFSILKVLGIGLSGLFGVLGTIHDFKDADGKVTKWGAAAIWGLSISVFIAINSQIWEIFDNNQKLQQSANETLESTMRIEGLLSEVDRTLRAIDSIDIFVFDLRVPKDDPDIKPYFETVQKKVLPFATAYPGEGATIEQTEEWEKIGFFFDSLGRDDQHNLVPDRATLLPPLSPSELLGSEPTSLVIYSVRARFFVNEPSIDTAINRIDDPDLDINFFPTEEKLDIILNIVDFLKDNSENQLAFSGHLEGNEKNLWRSNGKIISEPDLKGAWAAITFSPIGVSISEAEDTNFNRARTRFELTSFNIAINSRNIWFDSGSIEKRIMRDDVPVWFVQFGQDDPFN